MKTFVLRPLQGSDFDAAVELWNAARPCDPITRRDFKRKVLLDVNFDPNGYIVAEAGGKLVGFIYVVRRLQSIDNNAAAENALDAEIAWFNGFGVLLEWLDAVGPALIAAGESFAVSCGAKVLRSYYTPYYFTQGFDLEREKPYADLFAAHGYDGSKVSYAREIDLFAYQVPEELKIAKAKAEADGFRFCTLSNELLLPFWDFMNRYQPAGWRVRIRQLLRDNDDYDRVHVIIKDGEVIGFNVFWDPDGSPERFGPFGVRAEFRGYKLGQILLSECLYEMKKRGLHCAWMQSSGKGSAADHVYDKAGFRIRRQHVIMEKRL